MADFFEAVIEPCPTVNVAARHGELQQMKDLILTGHPVDVKDNRGWRATHEAAHGNHVDCLQVLLEQEATDVDWESFDGMSALLVAARQGHNDCVRLLLEHGADPCLADQMGAAPLFEAVKVNSMVCIELLVGHGASVDHQIYCGTTSLHQAASEGLIQVTRFLLESGASLGVMEEYNITPIFTAAQFGKLECLKVMLEFAHTRGESHLVNVSADDGGTAVYLASQNGHTNCLKILLDYGAEVNKLTTEPAALPLHAALEFGHIDCVKMLMPLTDWSLLNQCLTSPYSAAMMQTHTDCVTCLLEGGLGPNYNHRYEGSLNGGFRPKVLIMLSQQIKYHHNETPLALMAMERCPLVHAKVLLSGGARINQRHPFEVPPLILALDSYYMDLVKELLAAGAKVNVLHPQLQGNVVLIACLHFWKGMLLMLKCGADPSPCFRQDFPKLDTCQGNVAGSQRNAASSSTSYGGAVAGACSRKHHHLSPSTSKSTASGASWRVSNADSPADNTSTSEDSDSETDSRGDYVAPENASFYEVLRAARQLLSRVKLTVGQVLHLLLQYCGSVSLDPRLECLMDSQQDWKHLCSMTENPRSLMHLSRLAVRKCFTPVQLMKEEYISLLPLPHQVCDYVAFKD